MAYTYYGLKSGYNIVDPSPATSLVCGLFSSATIFLTCFFLLVLPRISSCRVLGADSIKKDHQGCLKTRKWQQFPGRKSRQMCARTTLGASESLDAIRASRNASMDNERSTAKRAALSFLVLLSSALAGLSRECTRSPCLPSRHRSVRMCGCPGVLETSHHRRLCGLLRNVSGCPETNFRHRSTRLTRTRAHRTSLPKILATTIHFPTKMRSPILTPTSNPSCPTSPAFPRPSPTKTK